MTKKLMIAGTLIFSASGVQAVPVDLSSWSALNLDFPGGQSFGSWSLQSGNTSVTQTINADPSFFLNNLNQTSYTIEGSWQVQTAADDDFMGFVFGYQNSSNFYLFDWKQITQNNVFDGSDATEGMTIKKYQGATGNGLVDLSLREFWENNVDDGDMTILAQNHGGDKGWNDNTLYDFRLDFGLNPAEIHILVEQDLTVLWDVTLTDSTFNSGQFGFYNDSQSAVNYAGFEQTGGVIVDGPEPVPESISEPGIFALMGIGLAGIGWVNRKRVIRG